MTNPTVHDIGTEAIVRAVEEMLQLHLRSTVTAMESAWGVAAGTIRVPDETQGYSRSRKLGNDSAPSVRIFIDRNNLLDQPRFMGVGGAWAQTILRVRVRAFADADTDTDMQMNVLLEAVARVIQKYNTAWWNEMRAVRFERITDQRGPSLRERGQSEGFSAYGRIDRNTDEEADLLWEIVHRQSWDISYSKDLPTPPTP